MDDMTQERLRIQLRSAQVAAASEITMPPVATIHTRLRRQRRNRATAACVAALALVVAVGLPLSSRFHHGGTTPAVDVSSSPPPSPSVSSSPSVPPSIAPTPSTVLGSTGPGIGGPGAPNTATTAATHTSPAKPSCTPRDFATVSYGNGTILIHANVDATYHLCPGQSLRAFWVEYEYQPDGSQTPYREHVVTLTNSHPTDESTSADGESDTGCPGDIYVVTGSSKIVQRIAPGKHDPYPGFKDYKGGMISGSYWQMCPGLAAAVTPSPTSS